MAPTSRPLSPHLQIYRLSITMAMSIAHRITGVGLYFGTAIVAVWLAAAALGDGPFGQVQGFFDHWFGRLLLFGYTWALFHHMLGGLRHFIWDFGAGYGMARHWLGWATIGGSLAITAAIWLWLLV
ncbi:MAG: succinate dehydrogenase, cytochrome b556 subunit [Cucumibacter sp.]